MPQLPAAESLVGFGCMRLSTATDRDTQRGATVVEAALAAAERANVSLFLDTADAYCLNDEERGHNERLLASALAQHPAPAAGSRSQPTAGPPQSPVVVATKGGMTRPGGRWVPNGSAKHLRAACDASRAALGVATIDLYLLHAPDPQTPLATSVRALATLRDAGKVAAVGLCNVNRTQLREALAITPIDAVQVALSPRDLTALRGGIVECCAVHGILLIAHSPLGGSRQAAKLLRGAAFSTATDPASTVLAWLRTLATNLVPIPGTVDPERAPHLVDAQNLDQHQQQLGDALRGDIDAAYPAAPIARDPRSARRPPRPDAAAEVVLVMGSPGAGKSSYTGALVTAGYQRINRDQTGGTLAQQMPHLRRALEEGGRRVVLDNTYPTRAARNHVIETAWEYAVGVRCVWLQTSMEQAQINAVRRMLAAHGRLLEPDEIKAANRRGDFSAIPPRALFDYQRALEPPEVEEGFASVERRAFAPEASPALTRPAVICGYQAVIAGDHPVADAVQRLGELRARGSVIAVIAWQPVAPGDADARAATRRSVEAVVAALECDAQLGLCTHPAGAPICWCRLPLPGLGVQLIDDLGIDPGQTLVVGTSTAEKTFANRLGCNYVSAAEFLG
jgi:aryl-alcohol dehydrogenase-like predicted oxidoreductase